MNGRFSRERHEPMRTPWAALRRTFPAAGIANIWLQCISVALEIAIRQKNHTRNPRSTVATTTEVYDFLRALFARVGRTYCPHWGSRVQRDTVIQSVRRGAKPGVGGRLVAWSGGAGQVWRVCTADAVRGWGRSHTSRRVRHRAIP